jgi:twinfilin-like protein
MSHQTGIRPNEHLRAFIAKAKGADSNVRLMKIVIDNEQLVLDTFKPATADWKDDYSHYVAPLTDPKQPSYTLFRLDETKNGHPLWLFISWSPDFASVKNKMLYAATKSTLKMELGAGDHIKDELFCTQRDEITLEGYLRHLKSQLAPKPLTLREEELELIKQSENSARINVDSKQKTMQGVMFPLDDNASVHLHKLQDGQVDYVQLCIDMKNEKILLGECGERCLAGVPFVLLLRSTFLF